MRVGKLPGVAILHSTERSSDACRAEQSDPIGAFDRELRTHRFASTGVACGHAWSRAIPWANGADRRVRGHAAVISDRHAQCGRETDQFMRETAILRIIQSRLDVLIRTNTSLFLMPLLRSSKLRAGIIPPAHFLAEGLIARVWSFCLRDSRPPMGIPSTRLGKWHETRAGSRSLHMLWRGAPIAGTGVCPKHH